MSRATAPNNVGAHVPGWDDPFGTLRQKWGEVPAGNAARAQTADLLRLGDDELRAFWRGALKDSSEGAAFGVRGWYHALYKDALRGKRVLDVGSGMGLDAVTFAKAGARVTCVDLVQSNLDLVARVGRLEGAGEIATFCMEDIASLERLEGPFDVIWCQGSLLHAPEATIREEAQALLRHLPVGGWWIELAYPKERWEREGRLPFGEWGKKTDGPATPWAEWYDLDKLRGVLAPAEFDVVLAFNFHGDDFNWFDLVRRA